MKAASQNSETVLYYQIIHKEQTEITQNYKISKSHVWYLSIFFYI